MKTKIVKLKSVAELAEESGVVMTKTGNELELLLIKELRSAVMSLQEQIIELQANQKNNV